MANPLYGEIYRNHGTAWVFGRRAVGRVIGVPGRGTKSGSSASGRARSPLSKSDISRLDAMTRGAPQVMVKIVSRTHNASQLRRHIDYISRDAEVPLESEYGPLQSKEEVSAVRASWIEQIKDQDAIEKNRRSAVSVNLMLSMPQGTDRGQFKQAVRDFVETEFAGHHETLLAFHDDTDKPHAHIAVLARDDRGKSLNADRDRLDQWRDRFASQLRDRGIDADATPRHARGVYVKGLHKTDYHRHKAGDMSKTRYNNFASAYNEVKAGREPQQTPWRQNIKARYEAVQICYGQAADELKQSADPKERDVGKRLDNFAKSMQPPFTRNDIMRKAAQTRSKDVEHLLKKYAPNEGKQVLAQNVIAKDVTLPKSERRIDREPER